MSLRILALLSLGCWLGPAAPAAAYHDVPAVQGIMLRASDQLLNLDADEAEATCQRLGEVPRGEAVLRFCRSLVALTRAEEQDDPTPRYDRFLEQAGEALQAAEALERAEPADAEVRLLLGLIHGSKALVDGSRRNYLAALQELRESHRQFTEALRLDPSLVDAEYGLGLYDLAVGRLPALVRPFATILLPSRGSAQGLKLLQDVAERGTLLKMTARVALLQLYAGPDGKPAEALRLGQELVRRYPGNPELYFSTAYAASELGRFAEALEIGRQVAERLAEGRPHFTDLTARYQQLMGKIYMDQGEYATALRFFQRALDAPTPPRYRWITAWAWTRSGMIYDLQGDRQEAMRRYRAALSVKSGGLAKDLASRYLEAPYRGSPPARS